MTPTEKTKEESPLETFHSDLTRSLPKTNGVLHGRTFTNQRLAPYLLHSSLHSLSSAFINLIKDELTAVSKITAARKLKIKIRELKTVIARNHLRELKARISQAGACLEEAALEGGTSCYPNNPVIRLGLIYLADIKFCTQALGARQESLSPSEREKLSHLEEDTQCLTEILLKKNNLELLQAPLPTVASKDLNASYSDWSTNGSALIAEQRNRVIGEVRDCLSNLDSGLMENTLPRDEIRKLLNQIIDTYEKRSMEFGESLLLEDVTRLLLETISSNRHAALIRKDKAPKSYQLQERDQDWAVGGEQVSKLFRQYTLCFYQADLLRRNIVATFLAKRLDAKKTSLTETIRPMRSILLLKKALPKLQTLQRNVSLQLLQQRGTNLLKSYGELSPKLTAQLSDWMTFAKRWTDEAIEVGTAQDALYLPLISEICLAFMKSDFDTKLTETLHKQTESLVDSSDDIPKALTQKISLLLTGFAMIEHCLSGEFKSQVSSIVGQPHSVEEESESKSKRKKNRHLKSTHPTFSEPLKVLPQLLKRENASTFFKGAAMHLAALQKTIDSNLGQENQLLEILVALSEQYKHFDGAFDQHKLAVEKLEEKTWPHRAEEPAANNPDEKEDPKEPSTSDDETSLICSGKLELSEGSELDSEEEEFDELDMPPARAGQPSSSSSSSKFSPIAFIKPRRKRKFWGQKKDKEKPTPKPAPKQKEREEVQDRRLTKYTPFDVKNFRNRDSFIKMALQNGYSFLRHGANHDIYFNSHTQDTLPVPRHKKNEFGTGLLHKMAKKVHEQKKHKS